MPFAPIGGSKNQLGMDAEGDSLAMGVVFPGIAASDKKGEVICLTDWDVVRKIGGA